MPSDPVTTESPVTVDLEHSCDWPGCDGQCHTGSTCPCHPVEAAERLERLAKAATPGPWHVGAVRTYGVFPAEDPDEEGALATVRFMEPRLAPRTPKDAANAAYIAAANPQAVLALIAENRRLARLGEGLAETLTKAAHRVVCGGQKHRGKFTSPCLVYGPSMARDVAAALQESHDA